MDTKIVSIGNSQGVRLPKHLLDACDLRLNQRIRITAEAGRIVIAPVRTPRSGWDLMFDGAENEPDLLEGIPESESLDD